MLETFLMVTITGAIACLIASVIDYSEYSRRR